MARLQHKIPHATVIDFAEILAYGVALTYGAALWLQALHVYSGIPQDWRYLLGEATVKLPLVMLVVWAIRGGLKAVLSRRATPMPRLAHGALVGLAMALGAFGALVIDGLTTQIFYPEVALTGSNPFLCTVLSVGVEAASAIPALGVAYDAAVTLPAMLAIAAALAIFRPMAPVTRKATI